jgi:hypothetical protein
LLRYALILPEARAAEVVLSYDPGELNFHAVRRTARNSALAVHETRRGQLKLALASDTAVVRAVAVLDFERLSRAARPPRATAVVWGAGAE